MKLKLQNIINLINIRKIADVNISSALDQNLQISPIFTFPSLLHFYTPPFNLQNELHEYFYVHYHYPTAFITVLMVIGIGGPYFLTVFEFSQEFYQSLSNLDPNQIMIDKIFEEVERPTIGTLDLISEEEKLKRLDGSFYEIKDDYTISTQELILLQNKLK